MKPCYEIRDDLLPWTFMSRSVHQACAEGRTTDVEQMSGEGADLNDADDLGNTPLWLAYIGGHLETVFALLELNVDVNRRTGTIFASDFHRACGWADEVFIDILCNYRADLNLPDRKRERECRAHLCFDLGFGKTPLIYAIEYRSGSGEEDLLRLLLSQGADVNHTDLSGLTPLFYAIYRGVPSLVELLLDHQADYTLENCLGYSPLRYALGCLSYANPQEGSIYQSRLDIVGILLDRFDRNDASLRRAILGSRPSLPLLFPLFDFIFYSRSKARLDLEAIGWSAFEETSWPGDLTSGQLLIAQNLVVFNQKIEHLLYYLQRVYIVNYEPLLVFYLQRVIKERESSNRFLLLLYCAFVEQCEQRFVAMLRRLLDTQRIYLFKQRRETLKCILLLCQQAPVRLTALCRRTIRQRLNSSIARRRRTFDSLLPRTLQEYLLLDELPSLITSPACSDRLLEQLIRPKMPSPVLSSTSTLSTNSPPPSSPLLGSKESFFHEMDSFSR